MIDDTEDKNTPEISLIGVDFGNSMRGRADLTAYSFHTIVFRNFFPAYAPPSLEFVMTIPDEVGEIVRLVPYTNQW